MAKYVPSGKAGGAGIALPFAIGIAGAAVAGAAFHFVGRYFYLILLFPLLWGMGVGFAAAVGVRAGKCRNPMIGVAAGVLSAVLSYGIYQVLDNVHIKSVFVEAYAKEVKADPGDPRLGEIYDEYLKERHGGTGFKAQLDARAEMGMNISRSGSGSSKDKKPMITGMGMYVYWGIELVLIAGMSLLFPLGAARECFCEKCLEWYEKQEVSGIDGGKVEDARKALAAKNYDGVSPFVSRDRSSAALSFEKCPKSCDSDIRVKLETVTRDKKGKEARVAVFDEMISAAAAHTLGAAAAAPLSAPPKGFTGAGPAAT